MAPGSKHRYLALSVLCLATTLHATPTLSPIAAANVLLPDNSATVTLLSAARKTRAVELDDLSSNLYYTSGNSILKYDFATETSTTIAGDIDTAGDVDGDGATARFQLPVGLKYNIVGGASILYVADKRNCKVRKIDITNNQVTSIVGNGNCGNTDGIGATVTIGELEDVEVFNDNLFFSDPDNNRIRVHDMNTGDTVTSAGTGAAGHVDGPAASAQFNEPMGLAIHHDAKVLYVADRSNSDIRAININTGEVTTVAGVAGTSGVVDGALAQALFQVPDGLTINPTLDPPILYLSETDSTSVSVGQRIRTIDLMNSRVYTLAGSISGGNRVDGAYNVAKFNMPFDVVYGGQTVYVADKDNKMVRKIGIPPTDNPTTTSPTTTSPTTNNPTTTTTSPTTSAPTWDRCINTGINLLLSNDGQSCTDACAAQSMFCSIDALSCLTSLVYRNDDLTREFAALGETCNTIDTNYGSSTGVPNIEVSNGICFLPDINRASSTYNCDSVASPSAKRRLCNCERTRSPTTPAPVTNSPTESPTTGSPVTTHPVTASPTTAHPATAHPSTTHPGTTHPATTHPVTASPTTAHPATVHPFTTHPGTTHPGTTHPATTHPLTSHPITPSPVTNSPVTMEPTTTTSCPTNSPVTSMPTASIEDCVVVDGPLEGWINNPATFTLGTPCAIAYTETIYWKIGVSSAQVNVGSNLLTLTKTDLVARVGVNGGDLQVHGCATLQAPQGSGSRTVCASHTMSVSSRPAPTITISSLDPLPPGQDSVLSADITHADPENITSSQRAHFIYSWEVLRIGDSGRNGAKVDILSSSANVQGVYSTNLLLPAGFLDPEESYKFIFKANLSSAYVTGDDGVFSFNHTVATSVSPVDAIISGGAVRDVRAGDALTLDGSASNDPDAATPATASYAWSCNDTSGGNGCQGFGQPTTAVVYIEQGNTVAGSVLAMRLNYSVLSNDGTLFRSAAATTVIRVQSVEIPAVSFRTYQSTVPLSNSLSLTADAISFGDSSPLTYQWQSKNSSSSVFNSIPNQASPTLILPATVLGSTGVYSIRVTVTDTVTNQAANAAVSITIAAVPSIDSVDVSPLAGTAFEDAFTVVVSAQSNNLPLQYQYAYNTTETGTSNALVLNTFTSPNTYSVNLPPGSVTIRVTVRDAILGTAVGYSQVITSTEQTVIVDPSAPVEERECNQTTASVTSLRTVVVASQAVGDSASLHVVDAVKDMCINLREAGSTNAALRNIEFSLKIIEQINPSSAVTISSCPGGGVGALGANGQTSSEYSPQTLEIIGQLATALWEVLDSQLREILSDPTQLSLAGSQSTQALLSLTESSSIDTSDESINRLTNTTNTILASTAPSELVESPRGEETAKTLSNLLQLSGSGSTTPFSSYSSDSSVHPLSSSTSSECQAVDGILHIIDMLLQMAGEALAPESSVRFDTAAFQADSRVVFVDTTAIATVAGGAIIETPVLSANQANSQRDTRILTSSTYSVARNGSSVRCRPAGRSADLRSNITSVTLVNETSTTRGNEQDFGTGQIILILPVGTTLREVTVKTNDGCKTQNVASCEFWDTTTNEWNSRGCVLNGTVERAGGTFARCECNHLTEFAVLARQMAPDCVSDTVTEQAEKLQYLIFSGLYGVFFLISAGYLLWFSRYEKKMWTAGGNVSLPLLGIAALCLFRFLSCLYLSRAFDGFRSDMAPAIATLVLVVLPYNACYWLFFYVAFQWIAIVHNTKLTLTPFKRVRNIFIAINVLITLVVWLVFIFFLFGVAGDTATAMVYGSAILATVCIILAIITLLYGYRLTRMLTALIPDETAGGSKARRKQRKDQAKQMALRAGVFGIGFLAQSVALLVSVFVGAGRGGGFALIALSSVYLGFELLNIVFLLFMYRRAMIRKIVGSTIGSSGHKRTGSSDQSRSTTGRYTKSRSIRAASRRSTQNQTRPSGFGMRNSVMVSHGHKRTDTEFMRNYHTTENKRGSDCSAGDEKLNMGPGRYTRYVRGSILSQPRTSNISNFSRARSDETDSHENKLLEPSDKSPSGAQSLGGSSSLSRYQNSRGPLQPSPICGTESQTPSASVDLVTPQVASSAIGLRQPTEEMVVNMRRGSRGLELKELKHDTDDHVGVRI